MCKKKKDDKKEKAQKSKELTQLLFFSAKRSNEYVRNSYELVTRCGGFAELYVDDTKIATTKEYVSGQSVGGFPGENWTGILPDVGGQRFGTTIQSDQRHHLKTCVEGKCLYELLASFNMKLTYFKPQYSVKIIIKVSYEGPCFVCQQAIPAWINTWKHLCKSLNVSVVGSNGHGKSTNY